MTANASARGKRSIRRWWFALSLVAVVIAFWLLSGWRTVGPGQFGVLEGSLFPLEPRLAGGERVMAPPGLLRLTLYPSVGVELPLPQAEQAMLPARDGSRFGLRGWITLRARQEAWAELHRAAADRGIGGVLVDAVREAAASLPPGSEGGPITATVHHALEQALVDSLARRGVDMRRMELDAFDFLSAEEGGAGSPPADPRLLVIGLDGADWEILDPLIEQGRVPNIARLVEEGTRAKLLTISPMLSPVIWTTIATGVEPSRHGILDFLVDAPEGGARQPVTSAQRLTPAVWEILSGEGIDVGVIAWWATWPADPVRGFLVSDRVAYQLFGYQADPDDAEGKSWPPDLYDEIRPLMKTPDSVPWDRIAEYLEGPRTSREEFDEEERKILDEFRTLLSSGETYLSISQRLRHKYDPRFEAIYLEGTDTVGHLFMSYRPPQLPGVDPQRYESFSGMVDRYYETADRYIGTLLEDRGPEWTVMIVSDHGFATDATRPRSTDSRIGHGAAADWHRRFGVLILSGANIRPGSRLDEASVYDIAPTILALFGQPIPRSWRGRVLGPAISPEFLDRHPVRFRQEDPQRIDSAVRAGLDPGAADLMEKLLSLGYISSGGETDSLTARNNAGVAFLAEGRFAEAEAEFRAGLEATPDAPMLTVNLAMALRMQGRREEAAELFEAGTNEARTLRLAGHMLAEMRLEDDDIEGALTLAHRVLETEPDASEVRNTLGLALERRGDLDGAREAYERAARDDPNAALARNNLGNLAKRAGDLEDAENWYLRAIEADPYFMGAYNNLALVYQARGEIDRAIDLYGRALVKAPNNSVVINNLASLHYATGDRDEARRLWARAAMVDPGYPSPLNNLASLEIHAQRYTEAERLLRRALELDPDYGDARMNLALIHRARNDLDAARRELLLATEDPRTGVNSWLQLAAIDLERGRIEEAIDALSRGRDLAPRNTAVLNALGEAYYRAGRSDEALAIWRESLTIDPSQPRLREILEGAP